MHGLTIGLIAYSELYLFIYVDKCMYTICIEDIYVFMVKD